MVEIMDDKQQSQSTSSSAPNDRLNNIHFHMNYRSDSPGHLIDSWKYSQAKSYESPSIQNKRMSDSYTEIYLPFSSNAAMKDEYIDFHGSLRIGKLMEDMDALAGLVAYKHADPIFAKSIESYLKESNNGCSLFSPRKLLSNITSSVEFTSSTLLLTIVTASVDGIHFLKPLSTSNDTRLSGFVSFVGKSSMEVVLRIESLESATNSTLSKEWELVALACFTMVARHPITYQAETVPSLNLITPEEQLSFRMADDRRKNRRYALEHSLFKSPPKSEESTLIHELFLKMNPQSTGPNSPSITGSNHTWMSDHILSSTKLCHPQDRNIHHFLFGGILMREAYELALANASRFFRGTKILFLSLNETTFKLPVSIGAVLLLSSQVIYSESIDRNYISSSSKLSSSSFNFKYDTIGNLPTQATGNKEPLDLRGICQVRVEAEVLHLEDNSRTLTNTFHFTFQSYEKQMPILLPKTYSEAMTYLEGKRRIKKDLLENNRDQLYVWEKSIRHIVDSSKKHINGERK